MKNSILILNSFHLVYFSIFLILLVGCKQESEYNPETINYTIKSSGCLLSYHDNIQYVYNEDNTYKFKIEGSDTLKFFYVNGKLRNTSDGNKYFYDEMSRLISATGLYGIIEVEYKSDGMVSTATNGNLTAYFEYSNGKISAITYKYPSGSIEDRNEYTYSGNDISSIKHIDYYEPSNETLAVSTENYATFDDKYNPKTFDYVQSLKMFGIHLSPYLSVQDLVPISQHNANTYSYDYIEYNKDGTIKKPYSQEFFYTYTYSYDEMENVKTINSYRFGSLMDSTKYTWNCK